MSDNSDVTISSIIIKYAPAVPVLAFVLALCHEFAFGVGLGLNVLIFYFPADFLKISTQYSPLAIAALLAHFQYVSWKRSSERKKGTLDRAFYIYLTICILCLLTIVLLGYPTKPSFLLEGLLFSSLFGLIIFSFLKLKKLTDYGSASLYIAALLFSSIYTGLMSGREYRMANDRHKLVVEIPGMPDFRLVRLLTSGVIVINDSGTVLFLARERVVSISYAVDGSAWRGLLCTQFSICDLFN